MDGQQTDRVDYDLFEKNRVQFRAFLLKKLTDVKTKKSTEI